MNTNNPTTEKTHLIATNDGTFFSNIGGKIAVGGWINPTTYSVGQMYIPLFNTRQGPDQPIFYVSLYQGRPRMMLYNSSGTLILDEGYKRGIASNHADPGHWFPNRDHLIEDCRLAQSVLCDTSAIDTELAELRSEIEVVTELSRKAIYENARTAVNQSEWAERNNSYLDRHWRATERVDELEAAKRERLGKGKILEGFIKDIENRPLAIAEFDDKLWLAVIDRVTVGRDGAMVFKFKNGTEITV